MNGIAAEQNRRKFRVWNIRGHVTMLPMPNADAEISVVRFFAAVLWVKDISYSKSV